MDRRRVITVALDGFGSSWDLLKALKGLLQSPIKDYIYCIKLNDAVHSGLFPSTKVVKAVRDMLDKYDGEDIKIFLDLKIGDVSETVKNTLIKYSGIDILTVSEICTAKTFVELRKLLPNTELALVSVLTDMSEEECIGRYGQSAKRKIVNDVDNISRLYTEARVKMDPEEAKSLPEQPFDRVVCSPRELSYLKTNFPNLEFIVPGIRDSWMLGDHQQRKGGVKDTLLEGEGRITMVMGAQILKGNEAAGISAEKSQQLTIDEIESAIQAVKGTRVEGDPIEVLKACEAYYEGPTDETGNFLGPLVCYAGKYDENGAETNYVGNVYFNFARVEEDPMAAEYFAKLVVNNLQTSGLDLDASTTRVVGAPMGGLFLASHIGRLLGTKTIFAEKQVVALADSKHGKREESRQVIDRHEIMPGESIILVEDVCNNLSTTEKIKKLVEAKGASLSAILCAVNRSSIVRWCGIPIISAVKSSTPQFKQNDPEVKGLLKAGNIVWRPKPEWDFLMREMRNK